MMTRKLSVLPFVLLLLLFIPWIAMQFSDQVNWSAGDFVVMGIMLLGVGFGLSYLLSRSLTIQKRVAYIAILVLAFLLLWAELAVGVFGSPLAGS